MQDLADKITASELEVMRVLWQAEGALTFTDIRVTLCESTEWETSTIKTLLNRLHKKGVVSKEQRDVFHYAPVVSEADYNEYSTQLLIDRLYAGNAKKLVAALVSDNRLSEDDLVELREMFKVGDSDE